MIHFCKIALHSSLFNCKTRGERMESKGRGLEAKYTPNMYTHTFRNTHAHKFRYIHRHTHIHTF